MLSVAHDVLIRKRGAVRNQYFECSEPNYVIEKTKDFDEATHRGTLSSR